MGLEGRLMKKVSVKGWKWLWRIDHARTRGSRLGLQTPAVRVRGSADPKMSPAQLPEGLTLLPWPAGCTVPWPSHTEAHVCYSEKTGMSSRTFGAGLGAGPVALESGTSPPPTSVCAGCWESAR